MIMGTKITFTNKIINNNSIMEFTEIITINSKSHNNNN